MMYRVNKLLEEKVSALRVALFLLFIFPLPLFSQNYPVHISNHLTPPYSGYLPDYADPASEKLKLILQLNDFSVPQHNVRLKFEIKGNGFTLSTKNFFNPPPIVLQPGQPLLITSTDLAPYLNSGNLDFVGINLSQYEQKMCLPEGYYSICVKAFDYYTPSIQLSNETCSQAWFTLSDPPFLNMPLCNSVVNPTNPQNIIFQWTPMNLGSPNSALNTEYEFALWECRPDSNANANQVVLSTAPIYSVITQQTTVNYGIAEPSLNLYMKYIWRVRAKDNTGRDLFKNNGYSQICTFKYGTLQNVLGNSINLTLSAEAVNHRNGKCYWTIQSAYTSYLLQVRKQGTTAWFDYPNTTGTEKIGNLEPETTYESRVKGLGNGLNGEWSNVALFTTQPPPNYSCNDQSLNYNTTALEPLPFIKAVKGLIIQSGQFEVHATQINSSGAAGWYSGKGFVSLMGIKKVPVKWTNIFIDSDSRHQQGIIDAETKGLDNWLHQWDVNVAELNATYVNGTIDTVSISGNTICYTLQGNTIPICIPTPTGSNIVVIRDGEGNQYNINLIPPPPKVTGPANYLNYSNDSLAADENKMATFEMSANQKYGFDEKQYAAYIKNYEAIKIKSGKNYFVSNKSIGDGMTDEVIASVQVADFNPALLKFTTANGSELSFTSAGNNKFKITGISHNVNSVYALYENKKIGKLNVISLKALNKKVVVVPVNNATAAITSGQLNAIFKQANVSWTLTTAPNFSFGLGSDGLEAADAKLFSKYSNEMRALRDAYKQHDSLYDKEAYYLFVVNKFTNPEIKGYMVRGRALGFVSENASVKEIAHELAHGAFALEHTFPAIEKSSSTNLMDYSSGTQLVKEQWVFMQFTNTGYNWRDEEEDASYLGSHNTAAGVYYWINKVRLANKNNRQLEIPAKTYLIGRADNCYLTGVHFDSIAVYVQDQYYNYMADVKGKIILSVVPRITSTGVVLDSCIRVDGGKILIKAPNKRLPVIKAYLESTNTFRNLILFVNGYRPILNKDGDPANYLAEYVNSNNQIEFGDSRNYWKGIDAQFMNTIGTRQAVYADGHHGVTTSNHKTSLNYLTAQALSDFLKKDCASFSNAAVCNLTYADYLHTVPNAGGFGIRVRSGNDAGKDLVQKINSGEIIFNKISDTLDVVAHSMGYAYAVGMISELEKANIKFGRFYILAPENARSGKANWGIFKEVWQYGADEIKTKPFLQDGVAPQCEVDGILYLPPSTKGGRVFIPDNFWPKGFLESHTVSNYGWIFNKKLGDNGYVKPRN